MLFPYGSADTLNAISSLGYAFFLFLNAVQMDFTLITKTGKKAWVIGVSSIVTPIGIGFLFIKTFNPFWKNIIGHMEADALPVVVISHTGCSFAVIASLLTDLGILNSELGRLALSSAFVSNLSSGIVAGVATAIISSMADRNVIRNVVSYLAFIIIVPLIGRPIMRWVERQTPQGGSVHTIYINIIIFGVLSLGFLAGLFNQPFLAGAVVLGLAVPEGPPIGSQLVYQFDLFATWFLCPIFVTCCTMKVNLTIYGTPTLVGVISGFIIMVHLIKWVQCVGICWFCNIPFSDSFCLALILSCKGFVEICSFVLVYDFMVRD